MSQSVDELLLALAAPRPIAPWVVVQQLEELVNLPSALPSDRPGHTPGMAAIA